MRAVILACLVPFIVTSCDRSVNSEAYAVTKPTACREFAVTAWAVTATGRTVDISESNGAASLPAASVLKVLIALATMKERVVRTDRPENAQEVRDLISMIVDSNNEAANRLIDKIGVARLNHALQALGLRNTAFTGHYSNSVGAKTRGRSSTNDLAKAAGLLLAMSREGNPRERRNAQALLLLMVQAKGKDLSDHALPRSEIVAEKIGETSDVVSDLSITNPLGPSTLIVASICSGVHGRRDAMHDLYRLTAALYWKYYDLYREEPEGDN